MTMLTPDQEQFFSIFARHNISISCHYIDPQTAKEKVGVISGFLLSIRGLPFFVTAGHVLENIEQALKAKVRIWGWSIADYLSEDAAHNNSIPFEYDISNTSWLHDKDRGIDCGFMRFGTNIVDLMHKNKINFISEAGWKDNLPDIFDAYYLFGMPEELVELLAPSGSIAFNAYLLNVVETASIPEKLIKPIPRFYGKISNVPTESTPERIEGMSGGPVFAIKFNDDETFNYWVIAVQSGWDSKERVIAACFVKPFGEMANSYMEEWEEANQSKIVDEIK